MLIEGPMQAPFTVRRNVAAVLGWPVSNVRCRQVHMGGGFGGKLDVSVQPYLGLAAWLLKRPVRMVYTREECFLGTGKRHPILMKCVTGADAQGRLLAVKMDVLAVEQEPRILEQHMIERALHPFPGRVSV